MLNRMNLRTKSISTSYQFAMDVVVGHTIVLDYWFVGSSDMQSIEEASASGKAETPWSTSEKAYLGAATGCQQPENTER